MSVLCPTAFEVTKTELNIGQWDSGPLCPPVLRQDIHGYLKLCAFLFIHFTTNEQLI